MESGLISIYETGDYKLRYLNSPEEMLSGSPSLVSLYADALLEEPSNILFGLSRDFLYSY